MFRNVLIADSGKGHVEEMVRMLRDIPAVRQARLNLLHVVPEQAGESFTEHSQKAAGIVAEAVQRLGLNPSDVNTIIRQGDTKQTVLKVADELDSDLIVMGSRGMSRLQSILSNSASQYVFQLSTRPMLLVRDDLYIRHINRVLVTIDGTGVGDDALKLACELVRDIPGGSLTGVHVSRQCRIFQPARRAHPSSASISLRTVLARSARRSRVPPPPTPARPPLLSS